MNSILGGAVAASLLIAGAPVAASSATTDPVVINNVIATPGRLTLGLPTIVAVSFENTNDVPATNVEFRFTDAAGNQTNVNDSGTFSKGVEIRHTFRFNGYNDNETASVAEVQFADGSSWENQAPGARSPRRQAAENPAAMSSTQSGSPAVPPEQPAVLPPAVPVGAYAL